MNAPQPSPHSQAASLVPRRAPAAADAATVLRHLHRERDFGVGYGNSSGYGSARHYADGHADPLFRCR